MNPDVFANMFRTKASEIQAFVNNDLPDIVGTEAVNHFKENFENEGFTDTANQPWQEVKRRINPRGRKANTKWKILNNTGELKESITYDKEPGKVVIHSDKPYAAAHNEGTDNAGRGNSTRIPKRQFIGPSEKLDEKIRMEIEDGLTRILK